MYVFKAFLNNYINIYLDSKTVKALKYLYKQIKFAINK